MPVNPSDVRVGSVVVVHWPVGWPAPHHGIVLEKLSPTLARIAVSTGHEPDDDYPMDYYDVIDWSSPPAVHCVTRWPKNAGFSYYLGGFVEIIPSSCWVDVPGHAPRERVQAIALAFRRWEADDTFEA